MYVIAKLLLANSKSNVQETQTKLHHISNFTTIDILTWYKVIEYNKRGKISRTFKTIVFLSNSFNIFLM